ncbi:MAG: ATP-binding cassette domain-containing protein, partial [Chlamydiota bacterium]
MITVKNLRKEFSIQKKRITVLNDLSFTIHKGETLGLVGESGCGKSTTGRCLLRLEEPTSGEICYNDKNIVSMNKKELFEFRKNAQIIFQDP